MAERLRGVVREGDTVARLGGDEFVVILGTDRRADERRQRTAMAIAENQPALARRLSAGRIDTAGQRQHRYLLFCGHQVSRDELIGRADLAMYQAKETGAA